MTVEEIEDNALVRAWDRALTIAAVVLVQLEDVEIDADSPILTALSHLQSWSIGQSKVLEKINGKV